MPLTEEHDNILLMSDKITFIYSTYPNLEAAKLSAKLLLEQNLIACANINPRMISMYLWKGQLEESQEVSVIFKTQTKLFEDCKNAIKNHHPYEIPCILEWEISQGNQPYLEWINEALPVREKLEKKESSADSK